MIKKLLSCVGEYKKDSILAPLTVTLEVIMEVLIPFIMAKVIDIGIKTGDTAAVLKYGGIMVAAAVISLSAGALAGSFAASASAGFAKNLRKALYYRFSDFAFSNIDRFSASSLVTRLTTDVTNIQNSYMMIIRTAVRSPLMLIFSLIMAFMINWKIALVYVAIVPVLGFILIFVATKVHPVFEWVFRTYDKLNRIVLENVRGARVVKSFVRENEESEKFEDTSKAIYKKFSLAERILSVNMPVMQLCVYTAMILISWFSAKMIVSDTMTTGELASMFSYTMQILMSLMMLSMIFVMIIISRASAERICEVLDEESELKNCENPVFEVKDGSVVFEHVDFAYKKNLCLKDINLEIKSGETVGIIGGTGSSKSTLVSLISRLYDTTRGRVLVGGVDVREYDIETLRNAVSVVLQKNILFFGTIKENLRWGDKNATDEQIKHACVLACADEFVSGFEKGYDTYIEQGGTNVSGGQKQRLCIARALLKKPKILILDDSTSAVDTKTDAIIRRSFKTEIPNTTKIIIAQRISSVKDADKIIVMDNGMIDACGTHDELIKSNEIYKEVYYSQAKGGESDGENK